MAHNTLQLPKVHSGHTQFPLKIFVAITVITFVMLGIVVYSFLIGYKISARFSPLVDAAMEIKLEATTAHLLLEEMVTGARDIDMEAITKHIDNSMWYATAMLEGGKNKEGAYSAISDSNLRQILLQIRKKIAIFREASMQRYLAAENGEAENSVVHQFHSAFSEFVKQADHVETVLQQVIANNLHSYRMLQYILLGLISMTSVILFCVLYGYEKKRANNLAALQDALDEVKLLSGFLPICSSCKDIRDDKGYWKQLESYISEHSEAQFSHSLCPTCAHKLYPDLFPANSEAKEM